MLPTPFRAVLDANVLFPFTLRDTLLRAAAVRMFQAYWSEEILAEATRNLVKTGFRRRWRERYDGSGTERILRFGRVSQR